MSTPGEPQPNSPQIVVVGAGQAACQLASSLVEGDFAGRVTLVGDEPGLPYSRPPLSKEYLAGAVDAQSLRLKPPEFFSSERVDLVHDRAVHIDRCSHEVFLASGRRLPYDELVLATGARNRRLDVIPTHLEGVAELRTLADADRIRSLLPASNHLIVVGGGLIGLELAAFAAADGHDVTVVEAGSRILNRGVSAASAERLHLAHEAAGVRLLLGQSVQQVETDAGTVKAVHLTGGNRIDADLLVVAAGVVPNTELARDSGLDVSNGIVVDAQLRTADAHVYAIGDCARFPHARSRQPLRLESVQNAVDQAKFLAASFLGSSGVYDTLAWFWTQQGDHKLQIAGVLPSGDITTHSTTDARGRPLVCAFANDTLVAVETFNAPATHMAARRLLASSVPLPLDLVRSPDFDLAAAAAASVPAPAR